MSNGETVTANLNNKEFVVLQENLTYILNLQLPIFNRADLYIQYITAGFSVMFADTFVRFLPVREMFLADTQIERHDNRNSRI